MTSVGVRGCVDLVEADVQLAVAQLVGREPEDVPQGDNFFLLGGTSVRATVLLRQLERSFGVRVPLAGFIRHPTVEHLAAVVRAGRSQEPFEDLAPHLPYLGGRDGEPATLFFFPHEADAALLRQLDRSRVPGHLYAVVPLRSPDALGGYRAVGELAERYMQEAFEVPGGDGWVVGGLCSAAGLAWEAATRLTAAGRSVARVVLIDPPPPVPWLRPLPISTYLSFTPTEQALAELPVTLRAAVEQQDDPAPMLAGMLRLLHDGMGERLALGPDVDLPPGDREHVALLAEASLRTVVALSRYTPPKSTDWPVTVVHTASAGVRSEVYGQYWESCGGAPFELRQSTRTRFGVFGDAEFADLLGGGRRES